MRRLLKHWSIISKNRLKLYFYLFTWNEKLFEWIETNFKECFIDCWVFFIFFRSLICGLVRFLIIFLYQKAFEYDRPPKMSMKIRSQWLTLCTKKSIVILIAVDKSASIVLSWRDFTKIQVHCHSKSISCSKYSWKLWKYCTRQLNFTTAIVIYNYLYFFFCSQLKHEIIANLILLT